MEAHPFRIKGIDFDFENKHSCNRLLTAVISEDLVEVKKLLRAKWDPNLTDNVGRTSLHLAARSSNPTILRLLLDAGGVVDHITYSGATPLCIAAYFGQVESVRLLLEAGASVSTSTNIGASPLHFASNGGSMEVARQLVMAGAAVDLQDFDGCSPLILGVKRKSLSIARFLLENGADPIKMDKGERSALHYACANDNLELMDLVLSFVPEGTTAGNLADSEGWTLLMYAAQSGAARVLDRLLRLGANTTLANRMGLLAIHLAAHNSLPCFQSLLNSTPVSAINSSSCLPKDDNSITSLPCLLIDKPCLEGLKLLFAKDEISVQVLLCPVIQDNVYILPLSFALISELPTDFTLTLINLYAKSGCPLDYCYNSRKCLTCIESLSRVHVSHSESCQCANIYISLFENGARPDPYGSPLALILNSTLKLACVRGSTLLLSLLLGYSNYLEPDDVLLSFVDYTISSSEIASGALKTIEFLCRHTRPWSIVGCKEMIKSRCKDQIIAMSLLSFFPSNSIVPPLRFLCRAIVRNVQHSIFTSSGSLTFGANSSFRHFLSNLALPQPLSDFIQYDDILLSAKTKFKNPSIEL